MTELIADPGELADGDMSTQLGHQVGITRFMRQSRLRGG
jgi:hypothetical protein